MKVPRILSSVAVLAALTFWSATASAHKLESVEASADCDEFTITVGGSHLTQGGNLIYNITLTPPAGAPIIISGQLSLVFDPPLVGGVGETTVTEPWGPFPLDVYNLSGTVTLEAFFPFGHTFDIAFSEAELSCLLQPLLIVIDEDSIDSGTAPNYFARRYC